MEALNIVPDLGWAFPLCVINQCAQIYCRSHFIVFPLSLASVSTSLGIKAEVSIKAETIPGKQMIMTHVHLLPFSFSLSFFQIGKGVNSV